MDIVPGEPIRTGDDDPVKRGLFDPIPQAIQARPIEGGATIAIITENILRAQRLTLAVQVGGEARNLLLNRLCQRSAARSTRGHRWPFSYLSSVCGGCRGAGTEPTWSSGDAVQSRRYW